MRIFISYRRHDSKYQARMIHEAFAQEVSRENVFMDVDSIPPGANFRKLLKDWVAQCDVLLALIGPDWINATDPLTGKRRLENPSDFVRIEISEALARDIPVAPILLDGAPLPDADQLPGDLKELCDRQAEFIEFRTFDTDVQRLIKKLRLGDSSSGGISIAAHDGSKSVAMRPGGGRHKIDGAYTVHGNNADGSTYSGTAVIKLEGDCYRFRWLIANGDTFEGVGARHGNIITVEWGQKSPVIYEIGNDDVLYGKWDNGRGTETLTPTP
jgi:hypothetical protein